MARTVVPYSPWVANGHLTDPAGTTLDPANGHVIVASKPELTLIRVTNTSGSGKNVTLKAGDYPPALADGLGDFIVTVAATTGVEWIGPVESGRFLFADGTMHIDLAAGHTGTITAFSVPRGT